MWSGCIGLARPSGIVLFLLLATYSRFVLQMVKCMLARFCVYSAVVILSLNGLLQSHDYLLRLGRWSHVVIVSSVSLVTVSFPVSMDAALTIVRFMLTLVLA